ncbi:hypothetical protein PFISCL1PPCAC_1988, partial [Pristionchus fissidentatus]
GEGNDRLQTMLLPLLLTLLPISALADLPKDLDTFLEKLFEFEECEDFVSNADLVSVATTSCKPHDCDFPRQICQRPANKFRDESANQCNAIPTKCITAANGGPLPSPTKNPFSLVTMPPPKIKKEEVEEKTDKVEIAQLCKMEAPTGRFCGFVRKWTYNRDTGECDQFWFPGCKTRDTNANLFDKQAVCEELALLCREHVPPPSTTRPFSGFSGFSPITLPPPPSTRPPRIFPPFAPSPQVNQGENGGGGIFGQPNGGGEFGNNLVSLIAQGFMGGRGGFSGVPQPSQSSNSNAAQALNVLSQFTNFEFGNLPDLLG